jgi:hypothetical protein
MPVTTWNGTPPARLIAPRSSDYSRAVRNTKPRKDMWQWLRLCYEYSDYSKTVPNLNASKGLGYQHNFNDYSKTVPNSNADQDLGRECAFCRALSRALR